MLSFLILILFILNCVKPQSNVCIWGREGVNTFLNGEYEYKAEKNGAPRYRKSVDGTTTHLWRFTDDKYYFTDASPGTTLGSYRGYCNIAAENPIECSTNWIISSPDNAVFAQIAPCPYWNCEAVITTDIGNGCNQDFNVFVSENTWRNAAGTKYWYFNTIQFAWICADSLTTSQYNAVTQEGWIDTTKGNNVNFRFDFPDTQMHTIQCIKYPTPSPTPAPTTFPTNDPSRSPTNNPTNIPTNVPIDIHTNNPTNAPILNTGTYYNFTLEILKNTTVVTNDDILNVINNATIDIESDYRLVATIISDENNRLIVSVIVITKDVIQTDELEEILVAETQIHLTAQFGDQIKIINRWLTTTNVLQDIDNGSKQSEDETSLHLIIPIIILILTIVVVILIIYYHKFYKRNKDKDGKGVPQKVTEMAHQRVTSFSTNGENETNSTNVNKNDSDSEIYSNPNVMDEGDDDETEEMYANDSDKELKETKGQTSGHTIRN